MAHLSTWFTGKSTYFSWMIFPDLTNSMASAGSFARHVAD